MKNIKSMVMILALIGSAFAFAEDDLNQHPAVKDAINADTVLLYTYWGALDDGYNKQEADVHPIYYYVPPVGEHDDCTVDIVLTRPSYGETDCITIRVQILDDGEGNLRVGNFKVERTKI